MEKMVKANMVSRPVSAKDVLDLPVQTTDFLAQRVLHDYPKFNEMEKLYLLGLFDRTTEAIAEPVSLTEEDKSIVLGRPPPSMLAKNMKLLTGFDTIKEVLQHYFSPGRTYLLSEEAIAAISAGWWTEESYMACHNTNWISMNRHVPTATNKAAKRRVYSLHPQEEAFYRKIRARLLEQHGMTMKHGGMHVGINRGQAKQFICDPWPDQQIRIANMAEKVAERLRHTTAEDAQQLLDLRKEVERETEKTPLHLDLFTTEQDQGWKEASEEEFNRATKKTSDEFMSQILEQEANRRKMLRNVIEIAQSVLDEREQCRPPDRNQAVLPGNRTRESLTSLA